jgi:uncharacterized protein (TIGR02646 family)
MIRIRRAPEAETLPELAAVRDAELARVRQALGAGRALDRHLLGHEYKLARRALAKMQHLKCCYCESRLQDERWEHVEHFRPKAEVQREQGGQQADGYWWLAWTWNNLLFACQRCNHAKGTFFPLLEGSTNLQAEQQPPGGEQPALIDPADEGDPREHIQFRRFGEHWIPRPRTPAGQGSVMLQTLGLGLDPGQPGHRPGLQQEWDDHAQSMRPAIDAIERALESNDAQRIRDVWDWRTKPYRVASQRFVALALDVLDHHVPGEVRRRWSLELTVLYP